MITQLIFDWAKQTPDRTAVIYNGRPCSYRSFAQVIAEACGYFARRNCVGPGYAVLAIHCLIDCWIVSLALRSLGLTTVAVRSAGEVGKSPQLEPYLSLGSRQVGLLCWSYTARSAPAMRITR